MEYKVSLLIPKVRDLISDSVEPFRWSNETMIDWINEGVASMFETHPEFFYTTELVLTPPDAVGSVEDSLYTTQTGQKVLINYVAYRCLSRDNESPENKQLAKEFLELYAMGV